VVNETQLGDPVVDALDRMAQRMKFATSSGGAGDPAASKRSAGKLADCCTRWPTSSSTREIRREVDGLTAEAASRPGCSASLPFSGCSCHPVMIRATDLDVPGLGLRVVGGLRRVRGVRCRVHQQDGQVDV